VQLASVSKHPPVERADAGETKPGSLWPAETWTASSPHRHTRKHTHPTESAAGPVLDPTAPGSLTLNFSPKRVLRLVLLVHGQDIRHQGAFAAILRGGHAAGRLCRLRPRTALRDAQPRGGGRSSPRPRRRLVATRIDAHSRQSRPHDTDAGRSDWNVGHLVLPDAVRALSERLATHLPMDRETEAVRRFIRAQARCSASRAWLYDGGDW
jgi:hypothetical protein